MAADAEADMRVIRRGMEGPEVEAWKVFLRGQGFDDVLIDRNYDPPAVEMTRAWQRKHGLVDDGVIGLRSYGVALGLGFDPGFEDADASDTGPNWPGKPPFAQLRPEERKALLGEFEFRAAPKPHNLEAIEILGDWEDKHIVRVDIPQLNGLEGAPAHGAIRLHAQAVDPFRRFFRAIEDAGLKDRLLSFGGGYAPRFIRGSRTVLSNHAFGSAIDLNVAWNMLGTVPALKGQKGCLRELVSIANANGLYWGGHFKRADGMHFELARTGLG